MVIPGPQRLEALKFAESVKLGKMEDWVERRGRPPKVKLDFGDR